MGDGFQIYSSTGVTTFATDHSLIGAYNRPILTLGGHDTQSSRYARFTSYIDAKENINMVTGKRIQWIYNSANRGYIEAGDTSMTINGHTNLTLQGSTSISLSATTTSISNNLDVGAGIDLTGNLISTGYAYVGDYIRMNENKKLYWKDSNTFISGNASSMTIDGDTSLTLEASNSISLNTLTTSISGNLDVGSGIDLSGNLITTGYASFGTTIRLNTAQKIYWAGTPSTSISGTATSLSILGNNTLSVTATQTTTFSTPSFTIQGTSGSGTGKDTELIINARGTSDSKSLLTMISDNGFDKGDRFRLEYVNGSLSFITDHGTQGTFDKTALTIIGNADVLLSTVNVKGKLIVDNLATFNGDIALPSDDKVYWNSNSTSYIKGNLTTMTLKAPTTIALEALTSTTVTTGVFTMLGKTSGDTEFIVKSRNASNGHSKITMIGDNGNDVGDGFQIYSSTGVTTFATDHNSVGAYNRPILTLTGHDTQSSRKASIYGKLEVYNGISVDFGSDATADMFYRNSSGDFARLAKGTAGQVLKMNSGATAPEWSSSSGGVTISNNVNDRVLTGDGTNANAEANMTFTGSALNVVGTISCDTSLTIDSSVLDASDILHIQDIGPGTATASKALVLNASKGVTGITTLGSSSLVCPSISTSSSNANIELDPNGSGVVIFKGNSTRESGQFKLNCENNSHGITIKGPPHSANATYTLTLPDTDGNANEVLKTDGSGNLSWTAQTGGGGGGASALNDLSDVSISSLSSGQVLKYNGSNWVNDTDATGGGGGGGGLPSGVTYTGSGNTAIFTVTGNIRATADITAYYSSDRRFKDNLTRISEPNEKIKKINGYEFDWNDKHELYKNTHDVGVVAQEIEEVLPEVVTEREDGYKAVKYEKIIALLIESNKDLLRRVEELEEKVKK